MVIDGKGRLIGLDEERVRIADAAGEALIPLAEIIKAKLVLTDELIAAAMGAAGIGFGGSCFFKDVSALKQLAGNSGYHFQLLNSVIEINDLQKRRVTAKLTKHLGPLADKRVAMLGLAFKPDTDDMRDASSLIVASRLQSEGARVSAYDPVARTAAAELLPDVEMCESALAALDGADAVVLITEWPEFKELDWKEAASRMKTAVLIDGRNFLDPTVLRSAGFIYEGIGRESGDTATTGKGS